MQIVERHFDSYFIHAPFACFFTKQKGTQGVPFLFYVRKQGLEGETVLNDSLGD